MSDSQEYTVETARAAADRDELGTWVTQFLASPGSDNAPLGEVLEDRIECWVGPKRLPIDRLHRLAGPPDAPVLQPVAEEEWDDRVDDMEERIRAGWEPSPVIVAYRHGQLILEDGNHRVESLRRAGRDEAWAVIGFESREESECFE